jgi:hypothetical protein
MALNHNDTVSESLVQDAARQKLGDYDLVTTPMMHPAEFLEKEAAEAAAKLAIQAAGPILGSSHSQREKKESETGSAMPQKAHGSLGSSHSQRAQQDSKTCSLMQQEHQDNHYSDIKYNDAKKKIMAKLAGMGHAVREAAVKMFKRLPRSMFRSRLDKGMYIYTCETDRV